MALTRRLPSRLVLCSQGDGGWASPCTTFDAAVAAALLPHHSPAWLQVDLLGDRLDLWRIHVSAFDADVAAGAQLNRDLAALEAAHGPDAAHVVLEARWVAGRWRVSEN